MTEILFTKRARKDLLSLEKQVVERMLAKIENASLNPRKSFEAMSKSYYCKLRAGDYRVIAVIEGSTIEIRRIGHRKNIYKKI